MAAADSGARLSVRRLSSSSSLCFAADIAAGMWWRYTVDMRIFLWYLASIATASTLETSRLLRRFKPYKNPSLVLSAIVDQVKLSSLPFFLPSEASWLSFLVHLSQCSIHLVIWILSSFVGWTHKLLSIEPSQLEHHRADFLTPVRFASLSSTRSCIVISWAQVLLYFHFLVKQVEWVLPLCCCRSKNVTSSSLAPVGESWSYLLLSWTS